MQSQENYPYTRLPGEELILRDYLAIDRTILANERTLLAYVRTGLAVVLTGASAVHFLENTLIDIAGVILVLIGLATLVIGFSRYIRLKRIYQQLMQQGIMTSSGQINMISRIGDHKHTRDS